MASNESISEKVKQYQDKSSSSDEENDLSSTVTPKNPVKLKSTSSMKISAKTPLESIQETDSPRELSKSNSFARCFGVKSYLHEFYDENPNEKLDDNYYHNQRANAKNNRLRLLWKISFWLGVIILLAGMLTMVFGYSFDEKNVIVATIDNIEVVDKNAVAFNDYLESCKIIGLFVFTFGGIILAASLIAPSFICYRQCLYKEDMFESPDPPINITYTDYDQSKNIKKTVEFKHVQPQSFNDAGMMQYGMK